MAQPTRLINAIFSERV